MKLCRKSEGPDRNTFRILDRTSGMVVHSASPDGYGLTLDQVEEYLSHHPSKEQVGTKQTVVNQTTVEAIREILKSTKPKGKNTGSQNATPAQTPLSTTPRDSHTPSLTDRNVALLEAVSKNLEMAIERDTSQLRVCREMIRNAKNAQ